MDEFSTFWPGVVKLLLLGLVLGFFAIRRYRGRASDGLRHAAAWVAIFAAVALAVMLVEDVRPGLLR